MYMLCTHFTLICCLSLDNAQILWHLIYEFNKILFQSIASSWSVSCFMLEKIQNMLTLTPRNFKTPCSHQDRFPTTVHPIIHLFYLLQCIYLSLPCIQSWLETLVLLLCVVKYNWYACFEVLDTVEDHQFHKQWWYTCNRTFINIFTLLAACLKE
mgnify:FL=1